MDRRLKQFLVSLWPAVLFWSTAMALFAVFRYYGLGENEGITLEGRFAETPFAFTVVTHAITGFSIGILYTIIDFFLDRYGPKKLSLGLDLALRTLIYFVGTIAVLTAVLEIFTVLLQINIDNSPGWWRTNMTLRAILLYILLVSFVFLFIKMAIEKFGKGVFLKMLLGKYKDPKEEKRIFMFLDLKDSTAIAERLGHFKYSQFIQDCFYDLNEVVPKFEAEIYQYVGDEAVLSWPYQKGVARNNCVQLFFAFKRQKLNRVDYYSEKYGIVPEFKAGLHGGVLMVAEVGVIKKELAYHGDVINTSARIQGECNTHNVSILISEGLLDNLRLGNALVSKSLGTAHLKGKEEEIRIHTLIEV